MSIFFPHCCIVTPTMLADAQTAADNIPLLKNSIRGGGGTFVGCLGEQALMTFLPGSILDSTYQHDVLWEGLTFECKTKDRTGPPKAYYNASVANFNTDQQADFYAFMSAERIEGTDNYIKVYFCGIITPEEFYKKSEIVEEGDYDSSNDWTAPTTSQSLHYGELDRCL